MAHLSTSQIHPLTGLRGLLALWVVLYHLTVGMMYSQFPAEEHFSRPLTLIFLSGFFAVDMFFLLSGFILCHVHARDFSSPPQGSAGWRTTLDFYALRLSRIYPVHLAVLLIYAGLKAGGVVFLVEGCGHPLLPPVTCERFGVTELISQLTLTASWQWQALPSWNSPAWSISSEWFMYLCFPLLVPWVSRIRSPGQSLGAGGLTLAMTMFLLWWGGTLYGHASLEECGLVRVTGCFLCGCFLYRFYQSDTYRRLNWPLIGAGCLAALLCLLTTDFLFLALPLMALLLLSLAQPEGLLSRALSTRTMIWLGSISYSLYMVHLLVMEVIGLLMQHTSSTPPGQMGTLEALGAMGFILMLSISAAAALYYGIEAPARRYLRGRIARRVSYG